MLVWQTFGQRLGREYEDVPVVFEDVRFEKPLHVPTEGEYCTTATPAPTGEVTTPSTSLRGIFLGETMLKVNIQRGSGAFEIVADESVLVTGKIHSPEDVDLEFVNLPSAPYQNGSAIYNEDHFVLTSNDIYKELRLRGYNYKEEFKAIRQIEDHGGSHNVQMISVDLGTADS